MTFQLPRCLREGDDALALGYLRTYYGQPYTGAYFDSWAGDRNEPGRITADDLIAVSFLSVVVPPLAARALLDTRAAEFTALLEAIGPDRDLADETEPIGDDHPVSELYRAVRGLPGVGPTITTKLLARKRPRFLPIYDSVVARVSRIGNFHWEPLRRTLREDDRQVHLQLLDLRDRASVNTPISALRVLDVVTWMEGKAAGIEPTAPEDVLGAALTDPGDV
ncbi:DUF6308 family protein [Blastococcus sp. HT6-30]|uniref:DUF6308 family protein n=1 Tax=Blastococcus sp. HT6-30 TaxID=3144843 RepID=UPI00321A6275